MVGSHILLELTKRGEKVRTILREGSDRLWVKRLFEEYAPGLFQKIEWVSGDVLDIVSLEEAMTDCDSVIHAAAVVSFHKKDKDAMFKVNVEGTANVVNVALHKEVKRFCHISSTAALGRSFPGEHINENSSWKTSPLNSQYAVSKYLAENEVWRGSEEGLNVAIVNPSIVIGAGDPRRSSGTLFTRIWSGIRFYPSGSNGFVGAIDVANVCCDLLEQNIFGERFLLCSESLSYQSVFSNIAVALNTKVPKNVAQIWMMKAYWLLAALREIATGKKADITLQSIRSASNKVYYDGTKITSSIGFTYGDLHSQIEETARFYLKHATS